VSLINKIVDRFVDRLFVGIEARWGNELNEFVRSLTNVTKTIADQFATFPIPNVSTPKPPEEPPKPGLRSVE